MPACSCPASHPTTDTRKRESFFVFQPKTQLHTTQHRQQPQEQASGAMGTARPASLCSALICAVFGMYGMDATRLRCLDTNAKGAESSRASIEQLQCGAAQLQRHQQQPIDLGEDRERDRARTNTHRQEETRERERERRAARRDSAGDAGEERGRWRHAHRRQSVGDLVGEDERRRDARRRDQQNDFERYETQCCTEVAFQQ